MAIPSPPGRSRDEQARHTVSAPLALLHRIEMAADRRRRRAGAETGGLPVSAAGDAKPALRPFLPEDTAIAAAIFEASVTELTGDDYSEAQQEAWAAGADDEAAFGKRLASQLTLIATIDGAPVGFASLKGANQIDLLYVHPSATARGVASLLIDAIEKLAGARGAKMLTVDASDTAEPFFKKRGYIPTQRNSVPLNDEWLANTTMQKTFGEGGRA